MKEITLMVGSRRIKTIVSDEELYDLVGRKWPQREDKYFYTAPCGFPKEETFFNDSKNVSHRNVGNMFRTEEEAWDYTRARTLIAAVARRRKELNEDWVPDWEDSKTKWVVTHRDGDLIVDIAFTNNWASPFGTYERLEAAQTIIKEFHDALEWFFTEYVAAVN